MELLLRLGYLVPVDNKDKSYKNCSVKDYYVTFCYLVSEEN